MSETLAKSPILAALAIEAAHNLEAIQEAVRGFARPYGYDRYVLFSASSASEDVVDRIYWVEGDWFGNAQVVDAETYVRRCPVTHHLLSARNAFFWRKEQTQGEETFTVVRAPSGPGIHGLQVPVFGPQGLEGRYEPRR